MNAASDGQALVDVEPDLQLLGALHGSVNAALDAAQRVVCRAVPADASPASLAAHATAVQDSARQVDELVGVFGLHGLDAHARLSQALASVLHASHRYDPGTVQAAGPAVSAAVFALKADVQRLLAIGQRLSPAALYPPYGRLRRLLGNDPARDLDFWERDWRWVDLPVAASADRGGNAADLQRRLESAALDLIRSARPSAAAALANLGAQLVRLQTGRRAKVFGLLASAYFEAVAQGWTPVDAACRRTTLAILAQQRALLGPAPAVADRLVVDLLAACTQTLKHPALEAPSLAWARRAFALAPATDDDADDGALASYLNDADAWSQRLTTLLAVGPDLPDRRRLDEAAALAATLADASRAVGFGALAELTQVFSQALQSLSPHEGPTHAPLLADVLDDIRSLLHQFAAGFVRQPDPAHLRALRRLVPPARSDATSDAMPLNAAAAGPTAS